MFALETSRGCDAFSVFSFGNYHSNQALRHDLGHNLKLTLGPLTECLVGLKNRQ